MQSTGIPRINFDEEEDQEVTEMRLTLENNKGYFSETTNNFQLGNLNEKEWAASEIVIFKENPMPFSVIAINEVTVCSINVNDLLHRMPKDIKEKVEAFAQE